MAATGPSRRQTTRNPASIPRISLEHARARWHLRQGLTEAAERDRGAPLEAAEAVVARTSWPRTLGGIDVYLSLRARAPGLGRAAIDAAVADQRLQVVPAVRGCIYVVPRAEVGLVLRIAEEQWRPRTERELVKAGSSMAEAEELAVALIEALRSGPLGTDALRRALPKGTVRSLGEAGKKIGMSSVLPVALQLLEFRGTVERTLPGGRMDSERYEWRLTETSPFAGADVPADSAGRLTRLARIFFRGAAPATVKEFAEWAALSQREARAAIESAGLVPVAVTGHADEAFCFDEDLTAPEPSRAVRLLSSQDSYLTDHGGPAPLCDPAQHGRAMPVWGSTRGSTLGGAKYVSLRPVLIGDRLTGFWEYDPDRRQIAVGLFEQQPALPRILEAAESLGAFIRAELEHGRSFNLDTDDDLRQRAALVQRLQA